MQPKDYVPFLYERMAEAVVKAWDSRAAGAVAWGLGHAVVGHNRRVVYSDGTAKMHGNTDDPEVPPHRGLRGPRRRHPLLLRRPEAAQGDGHHAGVSGPIGERRPASAPISGTTSASLLRQRHGKDLCVLGFCGSGGRPDPQVQMYRKKSRSAHGAASRA